MIYRGDNPRAREAADVLNGLYQQYRRAPKRTHLMWLLGQQQVWAIRMAELGTPGVEYDPETGDMRLFGWPVYRCIVDNMSMIVEEAKR